MIHYLRIWLLLPLEWRLEKIKHLPLHPSGDYILWNIVYSQRLRLWNVCINVFEKDGTSKIQFTTCGHYGAFEMKPTGDQILILLFQDITGPPYRPNFNFI